MNDSVARAAPSSERSTDPLILGISLFLATDRMLLHSSFFDSDPDVDTVIWSRVVAERGFDQELYARHFRAVPDFSSLPHWLTMARHFADFSWDRAGSTYSRPSYWKLRKSKETSRSDRLLRHLAVATSSKGLARFTERTVQRLIVRFGADLRLADEVAALKPSLVVNFTPFHSRTLPIAVAARRLDVPVVAFMTSFDNLSTKGRMGFAYDGYVVWSEAMRSELHRLYPSEARKPAYVVGAPQFDAFFQKRFEVSRSDWFNRMGLDPGRPVIVYCLGSPNLFREDFGALQFLERRAVDRRLRDCQVVLRTHPGYADEGYSQLATIRERFRDVVVQSNAGKWAKFAYQNDASTVEWVNTIRHADVLVNLSSSTTLDASICDRPVVNVDFDPEPGAPNEALIRAVNRSWDHYKPIAESGAVALAGSVEELADAVSDYLAHPERDSAARIDIVRRVCGPTDGFAGARLTAAVQAFTRGPDALAGRTPARRT